MKLTKNQKRVMYSFRRTGSSTSNEMKRETVYYKTALKSLMKRGLIVEHNGSYYLTKDGESWMPNILEDDKYL